MGWTDLPHRPAGGCVATSTHGPFPAGPAGTLSPYHGTGPAPTAGRCRGGSPSLLSVHERAGAAVLGRDLRHGSRLPRGGAGGGPSRLRHLAVCAWTHHRRQCRPWSVG